MEPEQRELALYFTLTYAFSWFFTIPLALRSQGILNIGFTGPATYIASFGPAFAAIALTYRREKMAGVRVLLNKLIQFKVGARWHLLAFLSPGVVGVLAFILDAFIAGNPPNFMWAANFQAFPLIFLVVFFLGGPLGEELGWRGYALERLQSNFSYRDTNLILGFLWGLWHLPLFFINNTPQVEIPLLGFMLQIMGTTFIYSFISGGTGGSVFVAMVFHAASNSFAGIIPFLPLIQTGGTMGAFRIFIAMIWVVVGIIWWIEKRS
jgi:CAAX protease family protein